MRALRTTLLLAVGLVLGPAVAVAQAGPGITFRPKEAPPLVLSGGQLSGIANLPARTYTLPPDSSQPGRKVSLRGVSIASLLGRGGISAQRVQVVKKNGGSTVVTPANFGTAFLADAGGTTYFIRSQGGMMVEFIETNDVPLEVSVDGGDLAITVTRSRKKIKVGESVTFAARIRAGGAPNTSYTYTWDYGEGPVVGRRVTATAKDPGTLFAQVDVRDNDPTCTIRCGGTETIEVEVGDVPEQPEAPTAGGANGSPGGGGSAGGTGGGGTGGSGGGAGSGTGTGGEEPSATAKPERESEPPPPPAKPFGETISGLIINDPGTTAQKLPGGKPAGAAEGTRAVRGGEIDGAFPIGLGGLLALAVMWIGALRERRGVRLRVA
ncbi:MAG TPA: PKD domain-containing protein [Solirubrobacteraceae bacterium]|nr:PKD domain-containing protein [Solirubrobacteraceae bacterium]